MFELQLISATTWQCLDRMALEEYEHGMALRILHLGLEANQQKKAPYLVLSTGYQQGEDVSAKGRVFVFEVVKLGQLDETGNAKLSLLTTKEQKAAITAVGAVQDGFLVTALGPKVRQLHLAYNRTQDTCVYISRNRPHSTHDTLRAPRLTVRAHPTD